MTYLSDSENLIERAIALCGGSQYKLAKAIGCSQMTVFRMFHGQPVKPELANAIHNATDGKVPKWVLRPDVFEVPERLQKTMAG